MAEVNISVDLNTEALSVIADGGEISVLGAKAAEGVQVTTVRTDVQLTSKTEAFQIEEKGTTILIESSGVQGPPGPSSGGSFGWAYFVGDEFTEAAPLELEAGVRTLVPMGSGATSITGNLKAPLIGFPFLSGGKFFPHDANEEYELTFNFQALPLLISGNIKLEVVLPPPFDEIHTDALTLSGQSGTEGRINSTAHLFTGTTFRDNGAELFLTSTVDATVWDIAVLVGPRSIEEV